MQGFEWYLNGLYMHQETSVCAFRKGNCHGIIRKYLAILFGVSNIITQNTRVFIPYNILYIPFQYDICDRFPDNFRGKNQKGPWFNTVGSNYGCSSATCCLWFPPIKCADVPLVKYSFLPFEHNGVIHNDCSDQAAAEATSITAAEIFQGSVIFSDSSFIK